VRLLHLTFAIAACAGLCGCATLSNGRAWGEDATARPDWNRVRDSAVKAAKDPWVWAPLAGAALFQVDDFDRRTADWARTHTPVFGSPHNADQWSDDLRSASSIIHYVTIAATPGGDDMEEWMLSKGKGALVQIAAVAATGATTQALKSTAGRERPNGVDDKSFPSGHTASSSVHTRLAAENLRAMDLDPRVERSLDIGLAALTIGTGWARIEAGQHYPSDTLVGMALGNFIGSFVNNAFLGLDQSRTSVALAPIDQGVLVSWACRF